MTGFTRLPRLFALSLLGAGLVLAVSACSGAQTSSSGVTSSRITISELGTPVAGMTAYDVVERYRGQWLRKRGRSSINFPQGIKVYLDSNRSPYGPPSSLREIMASDVEYIEHLDPGEAHFRYGMDNSQGAIVVHMRIGPA